MTNTAKELVFEGAGMTGTLRNDIENCRLRTRIKNDSGRLIYLEIGGNEVSKYTPGYLKMFNVICRIDHVFYDDRKEDARKNYSPSITKQYPPFEYTKDNVIKWVNEKLGCSFESMKVDETLNVHETKKALCGV